MSDIVSEYLNTFTSDQLKILAVTEGRVILSKLNFKLFCFLYFRDIMKSSDTGDAITLSEFHTAFIDDALHHAIPANGPAESRTAWICPRGSGKSTMMMMLIIWLAAHKHQKFVALFSATSTQSEDMLANIRGQFSNNELLAKDFPDLTKAATRRNAEMKLSDNKQLIMQKNGFICTGRGIDSSVLGMRIDNTRPTMILLDDIEGGESGYSIGDVGKRLVTLQDDILPLSLNAHVVWVGTTTRPKGLTENLVHKALGLPHAEWADTENFRVCYHPALAQNDDGTQRSIWPERWSTEYLISQQHTRSFKKNYMCLPAPDDYAYWQPEDFIYKEPTSLDYVMVSVDPAVTTKSKSDYTGVAVVGWSVADKASYVLFSEQLKLSGVEIKDRVQKILEMFPQITLIYVEQNQGGDLWSDLFSVLPVRVKSVHQSVKKEVRAATALAEYNKGKVLHAHPMAALESQMVSFPNGNHDDMVDAVGSAVIYFTKAEANRTKGSAVRLSSGSYA